MIRPGNQTPPAERREGLSGGEIVAEGGAPDAVVGSALSAHVDLATTVNRWLSPDAVPEWREVSVLGNAVEEAADPELFALWEEFAGTSDEQELGAQRVWLSDLAHLALERIGASLPA